MNKEQNTNQQENDMKEKNKKVYRLWKKTFLDDRKKLINKVLSGDIRDFLNNYRQIIHVDDDTFPRINYSNPNLINQFKDSILQDNGQNLYKLLAYNSVQDSTSSLAIFKYEILIEIENLLDKEEMQEEKVTMKKKKIINQIKPKKSLEEICNKK